MPGMQGPGSQQGQDNDRVPDREVDPNARVDNPDQVSGNQQRMEELNQKVQKGESLTQDEQQELNRLNAEAQNPGANQDENVTGQEPK